MNATPFTILRKLHLIKTHLSATPLYFHFLLLNRAQSSNPLYKIQIDAPF